jgi:hypothetical protein
MDAKEYEKAEQQELKSAAGGFARHDVDLPC